MGHQVVVVSPVPYVPPLFPQNHQWSKYKLVESQVEMSDIKVFHPRFPSIPRSKLLYVRGYLIYLFNKNFYKKLMLAFEPDIIHCHIPLPDGDVGRILSNKYNIPYGITVHGSNIYKKIHLNRFNYIKIKRIIENADFVGIVSKNLKKLVLDNNIYPKDRTCKLIYNGISPVKRNQIQVSWEDGKASSIRMLSVGHLIQRKGIAEVIRALADLREKFPNLRYYIIGEGRDGVYFKELAKKLKVDDIVFFLGAKSNSESMRYMEACHIFVMPSWNEAFGIVYIEAMYFGKITVGSRGEGIEEIIEDGKNGFLVYPKNPEDCQRKIEYIIPRLQNLRFVEENARKTVWPKFSWRNNAKEYLQLYRNVIERFNEEF